MPAKRKTGRKIPALKREGPLSERRLKKPIPLTEEMLREPLPPPEFPEDAGTGGEEKEQ